MTVSLNLQDDLDAVDGLETVTLTPADGGDVVSISTALRRGLARHEQQASQGKYLAGDVRWHLPADQTPVTPGTGARIVDANDESWTVLEVLRQALGSRWMCHCRNLAIAGGLNETITLQQAAWSKDPHGAAVAAWSDYRTGLRARVQPLDAAVQTEQDQRLTRVRYHVYLAEPVYVDENFRILRDGLVYRVLGYERPERIDELFVILAER